MALVDRIKGICLKPKDEWLKIEGETTSTADLFKSYALPLAAIGVVAGFIGMSFIGISVPFIGSIRTPVASGLIRAILHLAMTLVAVYVVSLIIDGLAPTFGAQKNRAQALKVAVYAWTPGWVAGVLYILPSLGILALIAQCYGIYILYLGLMQLMKAPKEKAVGYTALVVVCSFVLLFVVSLVLGAVVGAGAVATGAAGIR